MLMRFATRLLQTMAAESAHSCALRVLREIPPAVLSRRQIPQPALAVQACGLTFPTPVGLAAGFDKDGEVWRQMQALGFGHVEVGTVTPQAQPGNPAPRVFRLEEDRAVINRMGFPSQGQAAVLQRLLPRLSHDGVLGINIGKNKHQTDAVLDYVTGVQTFGTCADYLTINISSPNTPGLRDLQGKKQLQALLYAVLTARHDGQMDTPLLLKVAPDLDQADIDDIIDVVMTTQVQGRGMDGLIITNTTTARPETLVNQNRAEGGGLSGAPLKAASTQVLRQFWRGTGGKIPLVGVGGIMTAADAWEKITSGASLVQLYTGMVYHGPGIVHDVTQGLLQLLDQHGLSSIQDVVGQDV